MAKTKEELREVRKQWLPSVTSFSPRNSLSLAQKTAELVKSGAYEAAAGSCYAIFRCLAKTCKEHEDRFLRPDGSWTSQAAEPSGKRHPCGDAERSRSRMQIYLYFLR